MKTHLYILALCFTLFSCSDGDSPTTLPPPVQSLTEQQLTGQWNKTEIMYVQYYDDGTSETFDYEELLGHSSMHLDIRADHSVTYISGDNAPIDGQWRLQEEETIFDTSLKSPHSSGTYFRHQKIGELSADALVLVSDTSYITVESPEPVPHPTFKSVLKHYFEKE